MQTSLKLLIAYEPKTSYQPMFDFYGIAQRNVKSNIGKEMASAKYFSLESVVEAITTAPSYSYGQPIWAGHRVYR